MNCVRLLIVVFFSSLASSAIGGLKISGSTRYQFSNQNGLVTFGCDRITNSSKEDATGTILVRLWALDAPHRGGAISGKVVGEFKLNGLDPAHWYSNVSKTVNTTLPGVKRSYFLCLTALEYKGGQYVVSDYSNFSDTVVLGPRPLFTLSGPWSWRSSDEGGTLEIKVAKISHTRTGNTGSLELAVWATDRPYNGGDISGYKLGSVNKSALQRGYSYTSLENTAKYKRPPPGTYYISLLLSEFDSGYKIRSYLPAASRATFK